LSETLKTSLREQDLRNLRVVLSMDNNKFNLFYNNLSDKKKKYCKALLETYYYDILDYAFDEIDEIDPEIKKYLRGL
jgi:hypothetical protein